MAGPDGAVIEHLPEVGVTRISHWIFNCYVVHDGGDGRPFVVDAGTRLGAGLVGPVLERAGSHLAALLGVAATHGHADHVGGMPVLRDGSGFSFPMWLPQGVANLLAGAPLRSPGPREVARIHPVFADQPFDAAPLRELAASGREIGYDGRGIRFPFVADEWLRDGDTVPGAPHWQVLTTPGHTDDSISFWNERTRTLLSGDAVLAVGRRAWFNPEYVDAASSAATEERLRALDVEVLLPGHGRPVAGPAVMGEALSFRERPSDDDIVTTLRRLFRRHRHGS